MYISHSIGIILILIPLLFIAAIVAIGVVLYRHPSRLQKKWYQVPLQKRKRAKQAGIILGFCILIVMFAMPIVKGERFVSTIHLSAKDHNFITRNQINAKANESADRDTRDEKNQWLKTFYRILNSDESFTMSSNFDESPTADGSSFQEWKDNIADEQTGEYEVRLNAEQVVVDRFEVNSSDEDIDSDMDYDNYDQDGFYHIIVRLDRTFEENYQKLNDSEKKDIQDLKWHYKDGLLYATDADHKTCINGTAQYFMKDSKAINMMEKSGYKGIKKWMEQCEKNQDGIKVKVGNKTYLFHNTDKWYKFEKNGLTCFYNYKRFVIRFDLNKVIGMKSNLSDLPKSGREVWSVKADHSGEAYDEVILRSYNEEDLYAKKHVQIFLKDHKIKQMLIYFDDDAGVKGFTKEESVFLKACFEKMGISSEDASKWLSEFNVKKKKQKGTLGSWTYQQGNSYNQIVTLVVNNVINGNYVNFYKKSKGNN